MSDDSNNALFAGEVESIALFPEENPSPILRVAGDGALRYANRAAAGLLAQWRCTVGGAVPDFVRRELLAALESGATREMEIRCGERDLSFMLVPIAGRGYVNFYGRDITDRKQVEMALRQSEERVRHKLENILSPESDIDTLELADIIDARTLQALADDFCELTRIPLGLLDLNGKVLVGVGWQDICTKFHRVHPETCRNCIESDVLLSAGIPYGEYKIYRCKNNMWDVATPIKIGDRHFGNLFMGQFFFEDEPLDYAFFRAQARQYGFDETAYIAALEAVPRLSRATLNTSMSFFMKLADILSRLGYSNIKLARSLTERDGFLESLRESELFYRQILESIPGLIFTTRPDGYCDYQSQQWVDFTGVPVSEHLGDGWNQLLHPDDRQRAFAAWRNAVEERAPYDLEYRVRRHDGEYEWFKVRGRPIRNEAGEIVRWFGTALNIDQLVRIQEELRRAKVAAEAATRAKSEFLANMSHEIRTPMTVFMAVLEHLLQIDGNPEHHRLLAMANDSAQRLRGLIDDILDFSRIEARRVELEEKPFDLRNCVHEAVAMFELPAREKQLRLDIAVATETPATVVGDRNRLGQILTNLVGNAVKFTPAGGVRVTVQPRADLLEFSVDDTGIGIPEEKHHLLFQSFSQIDPSFHRQHGGSGLGLSICRGLVELMGGWIAVRNREGGGCVFTFAIPLKTTSSQNIPAPAPTPELSGAKRPAVRILLAEDEPMIRDVIVLMLTRRGWHVEIAVSGREAVEKWERGDFNLLLMDLQMPEMNGLEAARMIRSREVAGGRRARIIALTAHARKEIVEECLREGMDQVLIKPVQMNDLYAAIESCLSGGRPQANIS